LADVRAAGFDVDRVESDEFATICHFNQELAEASLCQVQAKRRKGHRKGDAFFAGSLGRGELPRWSWWIPEWEARRGGRRGSVAVPHSEKMPVLFPSVISAASCSEHPRRTTEDRLSVVRAASRGRSVFYLALTVACVGPPVLADTYPIVDTGQVRCYDNSREVKYPEVGEPFFGQDAQYQGNQPSYRDNGDGTITDLVTGLMWQKDPGPKKTFAQAVETTYAQATSVDDDTILEQSETHYDAASNVIQSTARQRGTVHAFDFDKLGRQIHDRVTTPGTGVESAVLRISTSYEVRGLVEHITRWDNATVGQGNIVHDVLFAYNDFGQPTDNWQSVRGRR
jgi:hypothetical protein